MQHDATTFNSMATASSFTADHTMVVIALNRQMQPEAFR